MTPVSIINGSWFVFLGTWVVLSFFAKRTQKREAPGMDLPFLAWQLAASILFLSPSAFVLPWPFSKLLFHGMVCDRAGVVLVVIGLITMLWARMTLGRNWSAHVVIKEDHTLVDSGPYAFVRHPIYTGFLLMVLGSALAMGYVSSILGFAACYIGFTIKLQHEEKMLQTHFGQPYSDYQKRTKRLIPFIF